MRAVEGTIGLGIMGVDAAKGDEEGFDVRLVEGPVEYALPPAREEAHNLASEHIFC